MATEVLDRPTTDYENNLSNGKRLIDETRNEAKKTIDYYRKEREKILDDARKNAASFRNEFSSFSFHDDNNFLNNDALNVSKSNNSLNGIIDTLRRLRDNAFNDLIRQDFDILIRNAESMISQGKITEAYDYVTEELKSIENRVKVGAYGSSPSTPIKPDPFGGDTIETNPDTNKPDGNTITNKDPYGFDYSNSSDIELIKKYLKGDIPIFLHGLSGCGKSGRVKAIDPNCVILYLASAKPETLSGKSVVVNGEMKDVPPEWYKKICKLCEDEPDKDHILFFDELTNAPPSLQGLAYNIILDKEVAGKWKLPPNCKIIAAGNDIEESLAASPVPEPLFRRFAHITIETTVPEWIVWASEKGLHPAIIAFIASNGLDNNPVFRTKCDGKNPCVDPRKWEMASKLLKSSNNPNDLKPLLGNDITKQFVEFAKKEVISLNQVLKGEYNQYMSKLDPDKGWRVVAALCAVDEKNVGVVVDFLKEYLYEDQFSIFKRIWTANGQDKKRVNILQEHEIRNEMDQGKGRR